MYEVSRSLYRRLSVLVESDPVTNEGRGDRELLLEACERNTERLATDPHYFARPDRTIFREIRHLFPLIDQAYVWRVVSVHSHVAREVAVREFEARSRPCQAFTRQGTPCQREPRPGSHFCPSHRHLEAEWQEPVAAEVQAPALAAA